LKFELETKLVSDNMALRFEDSGKKDSYTVTLIKTGKKGSVLIGLIKKAELKRLAKAS